MTSPSLYLEQLKKQNGIGGDNPPLSPSEFLLKQRQVDNTRELDNHDNYDNSETDGFFTKLGNFASYLKNLGPKGAIDIGRRLVDPINTTGIQDVEAVKGVGSNLKNDAKDIFKYYKDTPLSQIGRDAADMFKAAKSAGAGEALSGMAGGLVSMIETPISTLTRTVNDNGTAKPASPEQQIQNMQSTIGIVAQLKSYKMLSESMLGAVPKGEAALQAVSKPFALGRIASRTVAADAASGAISGGIGGAISASGQENQHEAIISSALSFLPLTTALGVLGVPSRLKEFNENANKFKAVENLSATHDIAATNSLRINSNNSPEDLIYRVDAVSDADKLVSAAINNKLKLGDGYIIEGVSPELGSDLSNKLNPSLRKAPQFMDAKEVENIRAQGGNVPTGTYVPPRDLSLPKPKPMGVEVKFESPFDKMAYLVAGKKLSAFGRRLLDDAIEQTGLNKEEIISHGKFIRKQANEAVKSGRLNPRSQAEIDALNEKAINRGKEILLKTLPGGVITDNLGTNWIRTNETHITNGVETLPVNEANTLLKIGRPKNDNPLYQPFANLSQQQFQPNFGRETFPDFRTYYSPANQSLLVMPHALLEGARKNFEEYGFLPREIVNHQGVEYRVNGFSGGDIKLENIFDGSSKNINVTDVSQLRRTNHSLQPEIVKGKPVASQINTENIPSSAKGKFNVEGSNFKSIPNSNNSLALEWWNGLSDKDKKTEWIKAGFDVTPLSEAHNNLDMIELAFSLKGNKPKNITKIDIPLGTRAPVLTSKVYIDNLYNKYRNAFNDNLNSESPSSYNDFSQRFFLDNGIRGNDISNVHSYFLNKLGDDLAHQTLSEEEIAIRQKLKRQIIVSDAKRTTDVGYDLANDAASNNLFFSAEGSGRYRLRHPDGSTYAVVSNLFEAKQAINKIRQQPGLDSDGGSSGAIHTGLGNIGGIAQPIPKVAYTKWAEFWDRSKAFGFVNNFTNITNWFKSVDNIMAKAGKPTQFLPAFFELQKALINKRLLIERDPALKEFAKETQSVLDMGGRLKSDRRWSIADNLDTQSIDEIVNNYIPRKANPAEIELAKNIAKTGDVTRVKDLLYQAKIENKNSSIGSAAYIKELIRLGEKVPKEIKAAAVEFVLNINKASEDQVSGPLVLKLAEAYENPSLALDKAAHARKNNITGLEAVYRDRVESWFKKAGTLAGIDPKARITAYLPTILNKVAGSKNFSGELPEEFARELTRVGITPTSKLIRDPNQLIIKYFNALINHMSGINTEVNKFSDFINTEVEKFKGTPNEPAMGSFLAAANDYIDEVKGYPSSRDAMAKAGRHIASSLGFKTPEPNSVLGLMSLGMIAGKPMLAFRDFYNVMGQAYQSFGHEFAQEFLTNSTNPEYVRALKDRGILAPNSRNLIDPGLEGDLLSQGLIGQTIRKWSEKAFDISGQEFAYEHSNASIYRTSLNLAEKYLGQLEDSKITKEQAYKKLGITANYGPGWIQQFDDILKNKGSKDAADFYGQTNMRFLSNVYGFHNNPVGWNTNFGRYLGQYGSYSVNATSAFLDNISKGNKKEIAAKILRGGIFNKATTLAGAAAGLNLNSWQVGNPLNIGSVVNTLPAVGPITSIPGDLADDYMQGRLTVGSESWKLARMFIPYAGMATSWVRGLDSMGQGNLIGGLLQAGGAPRARVQP